MHIEYEILEKDKVSFNDLEAGEIFCTRDEHRDSERDIEFFMKVKPSDPHTETDYHYVDLSTGILHYYDGNEEMFLPESYYFKAEV